MYLSERLTGVMTLQCDRIV